MEDFGPETTIIDQNMCDACCNDGETTPATSWCTECGDALCDNCVKMHRRFSATRGHEIMHLSDKTQSKKTTRFMCAEHVNEQVKLFCKDCNKVICHICCSINHRKCQTVVSLETVMTDVTAALENKRNDLERKLISELQQLGQQKEHMDQVTRNANTVESQIRQTSRDIQEEIRTKERQLVDDLEKLKEKQITTLKDGMKSREITIQGQQQQLEFIDLTVKSESQKDMFVIYGSLRKSADDKDTEEDMPTLNMIRFRHDKDLTMKTVEELQIGEVDVINYRTAEIARKSKINCKLKVDKGYSYIFDVVILTIPDGKVIVAADNVNNSIKMLYKMTTTAYIQVQDIGISPWQIAKISDKEIAITGSRKIIYLEFNPRPVITATVDTDLEYYSLSCLSPTQLVGGADGIIHVIERDGKVSQTISNVITTPQYIHLTEKSCLLISDTQANSVVSMTVEGKINFMYSPEGGKSLKHPRGITTTGSGDILVADRDNGRVIQLTESGQFVRELLTKENGLHDPRGMYFDDDMVYITSDQYVKVYKFL